LYYKAASLANLDKNEEALTWIDKALTIDPTNQQLLDAKEQLQR
jgi:hypothetical protein